MNRTETLPAQCPCCGEPIELIVDCSIEHQDYTEDCPVCCRPMVVAVRIDAEEIHLEVDPEND
jgi:hypothetical protein